MSPTRLRLRAAVARRLPHPLPRQVPRLLPLLLAGCAVPLTMEAGRPVPPIDRFPAGAVEVERAAEDGVLLRGVSVPAEATRAWVLHLMPRGTSSAGHPWLSGFRETLGTLQADGYASLVMDYRGVGRSDGALDDEAFPLDAAAMLQEATAAADGKPLVIRATSLGTLAWAVVADSVPPPAALVLVAPIDAATITDNAYREVFGSFLGTFLAWFRDAPAVPSLRETLERHPVPTLLLLAEEDTLLPPEEREALLRDLPAHVEAHVFPLDHEQLATRILGFEMTASGGGIVPTLLPEEQRFLDATFDADAPLRADTDADWYEVVARRPGPEVSDPVMRRRIEESGHPWKVRDRATGIEMVLVLPGEFLMGSAESEAGRGSDEGPQHRVELTRAYYLGTTEVTQAQWRRMMGPLTSFWEGDELPMDPSLEDLRDFLAKANAGNAPGAEPLRLPTEAEWEYACRAGSTGPFHFDAPIAHELVNFNDGEVRHAVVVAPGQLQVEWNRPPSPGCRMATAPAGSLPPNAWGLHEMHGNVQEWCADRYLAAGYPGRGERTVDPLVEVGDPDDENELHVVRGGSWYENARDCRAANRDFASPRTRSNRIGARLARSL